MCTVVCRWSPGTAVHMLALRDEFVGRPFDDPDAWWPEQPDVVGGRDRQAGGTWCACDVRTGAVAVVLNRPDRPVAGAEAASRGVLPLLAVAHGVAWSDYVDVAIMASFNLMLATPGQLTWWTFDGISLVREDLDAGVHLAKPRGLVPPPLDPRLVDDTRWLPLLQESRPQPDPSGLLVRVEHEDRVYATVFAQVISSFPGSLSIASSRTPQDPDSFRTAQWG